jgi:hypothetical protein
MHSFFGYLMGEFRVRIHKQNLPFMEILENLVNSKPGCTLSYLRRPMADVLQRSPLKGLRWLV